jgi:hypothetical protein
VNHRHGIAALLALVLVLTAAPGILAQEADVMLPVSEEDLLILEVRAARYLASNGILGYRHGDQVLLPLGELAAALEYAIFAYPDRGRVEGWLIDEERSFELDVGARRVEIGDRQLGIDEPCLYVNPDDVFVTSDVLMQWWPVDIEVDLRGLRVLVTPREPVPLVARLEREAMWARMDRRSRGDPDYPRREAGYRMAAWPFLDATVAIDRDEEETRWEGSLLSRGDLARMSVTGFLGYDDRVNDDWTAWLRAGRQDREGRLLGPLHATSVSVGDVASSAIPLIASSRRGRGVRVSNRPIGSVSQFDAVDVNGDAPPGWQVELYLDGALHDLQTASSDGGYSFAAVPLHLGLNTIRAVLYGPNGQKREQVRTYNIRSGMWGRGHLHYDVSTLQAGRSIVGSRTSAGDVQAEGEWLHQVTLGYGLSPTTTVTGAYVRATADEGVRDYAHLQLLQSVGPIFMQAVGVKDLASGQGGSVSAQTRLGRQSLLLSYSQFDDLVSGSSESRDDLARRAEARLSGSVVREGRPWLNYRFKWQHDAYDEQGIQTDFLSGYLGKSWNGFNLSNELRQYLRSGEGSVNSTQGQLLASGYVHGVRVLGDLLYDVSRGDGVQAAGITAARQFTPRLSGQITGRRSFLDDGSTYLQANLDWRLRPVKLGLRARHDSYGGSTIGVSATTSLARAPDRGGWLLSGRKLTSQGAALVQAFIDRDHDGAFGGGDETLAGVGFGRNDLWREIRTADDGRAFLPGLQANQFVNVKVDLETVEDPYLVPVHDGLTTVVHPGGVSSLAFPFHYVGEIEGVVARDHALTRPLRNIGLELLDEHGDRVATAVSEFDGFYLFQDVLPGDYFIGVVETTLRGQPYLVPEPQPVSVPEGGDFVAGPPIILPLADDEMPVLVAENEEAELPIATEETEARTDEPALADDPLVVAEAGGGTSSGPGPSGGGGGTRGSGGSDGSGGSAGVGGSGRGGRGTGGSGPDSGVSTGLGAAGGDGDVTDAGSGAGTRAIAGTAPADGESSATPSRRVASPAGAEGTVVAAAVISAETSPETRRTLHLIYEMLYESELFASTAGNR